MKAELLEKLCFFVVLMTVVVVGCNSGDQKAKALAPTDTIKFSKNEVAQRSLESAGCDSTVINNEFSTNALAFKVFKADTGKIKGLFLNPVVLKIEKKTNDQGGAYDQYDFTDGKNKIILNLNPKEGFYIEDAQIKNEKVRLNKKIEIGMQEDALLKLIKISSCKCDTITVKDDESTFESIYIFNDAKLAQVKMGQVVE